MEAAVDHPPEPRRAVIHPLAVGISHWINAFAVLIMILSGWRIYDASPLFHFQFPDTMTLGGWLAGALQWHFAAMWLLAINGVMYVLYGIFSGHYRHRFFPLTARAWCTSSPWPVSSDSSWPTSPW